MATCFRRLCLMGIDGEEVDGWSLLPYDSLHTFGEFFGKGIGVTQLILLIF